MGDPRSFVRRWPLSIRLTAVAVLILAVWVPILHRWLWGPAPARVADARAWEWPVSTPEQQGLDSKRLGELVGLIREGNRYPGLHSLLVVRRGRLVVEEYFNGWSAERMHTLQSVSKSFTSALVGIAIGRGELKGTDERILAFFPDAPRIAHLDERKASIRIEDLLTMRSGTDYHERGLGSPHAWLNLRPWGWDTFYLDRPMLAAPGTTFRYDSGGVILISSLLRRRTGLHADAYAERHLFRPLGIRKRAWLGNWAGHTHAGGGLYLTARDTARFGLLYLRNGRWADEQVVPEAWVRESFRRHVEFDTKGRGVVGYGYLWWVLAPDPNGSAPRDIYAAIGRMAQYVFVVPEHDMVVVVNGSARAGADQGRPIEFLYSYILPAVRRPPA